MIVLCPAFSEEDLKLSENLMEIAAQSGLNIPSDIVGSILSCLRFDISVRKLFSGSVLVGSFSPPGSLLKGGPIF